MADTLFTFDDENVINEGPVTCLGIRFENDAKRRAFFREELRKKLPELRLIEGFPVGEDDDIIALSDPPYYTACPNPWINDFIKEWEAEKSILRAEGKRTSHFEVKEPYAADVSEGKNNPVYLAHAYHTKVPHPAIMRYILHYTQPGDTVFDGFCGTGMTGVAANLCGSSAEVNALHEKNAIVGVRHGICSDLSPAASSIAAGYNAPFNVKQFKQKALSILDQLDEELGWMFETNVRGGKAKVNSSIWSDVFVCPSCNNELVLWDVAVDEDSKTIKDEFNCPHCGNLCSKKTMKKAWETVFDSILDDTISINKKVPVKFCYSFNGRRGEKVPDESDYQNFQKIDRIVIQNPHTAKLQDGFNTSQPIQSNGVTHTHLFYTRRSYVYYCRMYELIKDDIHLLNWFTSVLQSTSKMNRFRFSGTGINSGTLYIPSLNWEFTPSQTLKRKIESLAESGYKERGNSLVSVMSATQLSVIRDNSIDYMFIDPPFGANLMYSELNILWESWLNVKTDNKPEAIVNPVQKKDLFDYQSLMNASLKEFYRILKPGKWLTMEFSNTSAAVWNSIQNALQGVGFVVVNVAALDKQQGSFKAVTSPTAVKQDLIITCYKPTDDLTEKFLSSANNAQNIWEFTEDLLEHLPVHLKKDNATTAVVERSPKILFDRLIAYYVQHGYQVPIDAADFQKGLKDRFVERDGMFFTAEQAIEYEDKKKETTAFVSLALLVGSEAEGIEWLKRKLEEGPKTYSEILPDWMQDLVKPKKGDTLPELMQILDENFLKDENGYWHIPDLNDQAQLDAVRNKRLLKEFEVYVEAKKVKNARLEALRAGFKECYKNKDFATIVAVGDKIDEELLTTDEVLLRFYDIASSRV
jgi:DNA modification methylase